MPCSRGNPNGAEAHVSLSSMHQCRDLDWQPVFLHIYASLTDSCFIYLKLYFLHFDFLSLAQLARLAVVSEHV